MNDLVVRLSKEQHIEASTRPDKKSVKLLKDAIDRGYVHMKFTKTGTELGIRLDTNECDFSQADYEGKKGIIKIVGSLILNYVRVTYVGTVDLAKMEGTAHLVPGEELSPGWRYREQEKQKEAEAHG